ncbi:MAG: hypothetical protein ACE5DO_07180 [Desulfobacterales bacterium]
MRTTLDIDDDVLAAVKEMARKERMAAGRILSALAREALIGNHLTGKSDETEAKSVGGFRPFPSRGAVVSNEQIDRFRDQEGL